MAKPSKQPDSTAKTRPPARTPEARENQMIAMAYNLAEQQLREGKASSQVITHFLKMGTQRERLENEIRKNQRDLLEAKTDSIKASKHNETLYKNAIKAMKEYSGGSIIDEEEIF